MPEKIILENDSTFVYYVDIEKGVVAAVMENPIHKAAPFIDEISHAMHNNDVFLPSVNTILEEKLYSPIRAKATCAEEDEFNLEYGMKLAKKRCLAKYHKKLTQVFVEINNKVDPFLTFIENKIISCAEKYECFSEVKGNDN